MFSTIFIHLAKRPLTEKEAYSFAGYSEKERSFKLWQYLGKFWLFINMILNTMVDLLMFIATVIFFKDTKTPMAAPPNSASNGRRIVHRIINLDDLKLVKNAMNVVSNLDIINE